VAHAEIHLETQIGKGITMTITQAFKPMRRIAGLALAGFLLLAPLSGHAQTSPPATTPPAIEAPAVSPPVINDATETVDNPYGLSALWQNGDFVARGTLLALVIMSLGSWYIMITKWIEQAQLLRQGNAANATFWAANSLREGTDRLGSSSAFRMVAEDGLRAGQSYEGSLAKQVDLNSWILMSLQRSIDAINNKMQGGLAFLATVGSTAPFVGLFGTVWGIYHALTAIGIAGQASIDKVAGPVGEALIMTALGLAVAVPAVLGYNWMVRRNKVAMDRVRGFAADLHTMLVGGKTAKSAVRGA
jgi:biopolymer transport protein ExbB